MLQKRDDADQHPYFQQWPSLISAPDRSSRLLSKTLNSANGFQQRNIRTSNQLQVDIYHLPQNQATTSQLSPLKMATTQGYFLKPRPDYCKLRIQKLKTYFNRKNDVSSDEPRYKSANSSEESIQKVRQFIRENNISEEQKKNLQQMLNQNEKVMEIYTVRSTSQQNLHKRIIYKETRNTRQPSYKDNESHILNQLIKQKPQVVVVDDRKASQRSKASSVNLKSEDSISFEQIKDELDGEVSGDETNNNNFADKIQQEELKNAFKQVVVDIKTNIFPRHQKKPSQSFFSYIKHQDKIKDLVENFDMDDNQNPAFFFSQNQTLFPKKFDISNCYIQKKRLDFSNLQIGDAYIQIIANYLTSKTYKNVKQMILSNNAITHKGLEILLQFMPENIRELNLKNNQIGRQGAKILAYHFQHKLFNIKDLNMQDNNIGDYGCKYVLEALTKNCIMKRLNLSENSLSDRISTSMFNFLSSNKSIEILILHWNKLGSLFGVEIAKALSLNKSVRVLDLSYNALGSSEDSECVQEWSNLLEKLSLGLNHLDISFNQFTGRQLKRLDVALQKNTSIYGLHIEGNLCSAYVDPNGFIRFDDEDKGQSIQQKMYKIDGVNFLPLKQSTKELNNTDCCWICQGWMEVKFQYTPSRSGQQLSAPVFLHLDFQDFQPLLMSTGEEIKNSLNVQQQSTGKKQMNWDITTGEIIYQLKELETGEKRITMASIQEAYSNNHKLDQPVDQFKEDEEIDLNYFASFKMCPPDRKINYFFSNPEIDNQFIAQDHSSDINLVPIKGKLIIFQDDTIMELKEMDHLNYIETKQEYVLDDKNGYKPLIGVYPRAQERKYALKKQIKNQIRKKFNLVVWSKENSIFKDFQGDTESHLDACFEFDWGCSKIQRFIRNEYDKQKIKEHLREFYPLLKDLYKFYSSSSLQIPQYQIYCLPFNIFMRFIHQTGIIDGEQLKGTDIEMNLISIKNNLEQKFIYNPEKALIRYQFVEMFFRIANDKYVRTGQCKQYADALYKLMKMEVEPNYQYFDITQQWREMRFWNKECDQLMRFKLPFLIKLYDYVTEISQRRWYFRLKWISLKEFKDFMYKLELLGDTISERDTMAIYCLSMQTQIDEIAQDRHIRMNLNEFFESLSRLAEKISPCPMGQSFEKWDLKSRQCLPLCVKLETLITYIFQKIRNKDFEQFYDRFSHEDPSQSMPKIQNKNKSDKTINEVLDAEQNRVLDQIFHTNDVINKRIISVVGVVAYIELFKQPYVQLNLKDQPEEQVQIIPTVQKKTQNQTILKGQAKKSLQKKNGKFIKFQDES